MGRACGTSVVSMNDIRMVELAKDLNLAVETPDHLGIRQEIFADELEGNDTIQFLVPCLEHLAGAAFAKALQQQIGAKHKIGTAALQKLIHLKRSQPAALQQFPAQFTRRKQA